MSGATDAIFDPFNIYHVPYKTVASHSIQAAILVPKSLKVGKHPLAINIHGGFLLAGDRTFSGFFHQWLLDLSQDHNAIIVSADYRLLPTPNGLKDINEDLSDFWAWTRGDGLKTVLADKVPGAKLDFDKVLLVGGSAGGYGATQLALSYPDDFNVLAPFYPMVDFNGTYWRNGPSHDGPAPLHLPPESIMSKEEVEKIIRKEQNDANEGRLIQSEAPMQRFAFAAGVAWHGLFWKLFDPKGEVGKDELPVERLRNGSKLPKKLWLVHGEVDTAVPIEGAKVFVNEVKSRLGDVEVMFDIEEGKDHGADSAWDLQDVKVQKKLEWVVDGWLRRS